MIPSKMFPKALINGQLVKSASVLAEALGLIPKTHIRQFTVLVDLAEHTHGTHTYT